MAELDELQNNLKNYLHHAAATGVPLHTVEKNIFSTVLKMGGQALNYFFMLQGDGDVGEKLAPKKGEEVKRLDKSIRYYQSIFGKFKLERYRYGSRKGQKIACIPFDTRLELPKSDYGFLLQEWSQMMAVEVPYKTTSMFLEKIFPIKVPVDSLERINRMQSADVATFRSSRTIDATKEESIIVTSADGKGVPIRHKKDQARIEEHKRKKGPKPDRKRMAVVGSVYSVAPFVRTPGQVVEALFIEPEKTSRELVPKRPKPQNKKVVAHLTREVNGETLNATRTTFNWIMAQVNQRNPEWCSLYFMPRFNKNDNNHMDKLLVDLKNAYIFTENEFFYITIGKDNKINIKQLTIASHSGFKELKAESKNQITIQDGENYRCIHKILNPAHLQKITSITGHTHTKNIKICIALMDGQPSLWEESQRQFGKGSVIEVLDILHVTPRLWEAANIFYPENQSAQILFMKDRVLRVLEGETKSVMSGFRQMATKQNLSKHKLEKLEKACHYLEKNISRMKYNEYLKNGYPIASGVIEGACRHFVKDRMERAGMRWSIDGAQAMLDMRSTYLNDDWDEFTAYRIKKETARLYSYRNVIKKIDWPLVA
jgi:hypothetical protein